MAGGLIAKIYGQEKESCAVELLSSAICNLHCYYCYIPKVKSLARFIQPRVVKAFKDGTYIDILRKVYGEDLEYLTFWGAEPSLAGKYSLDFIREAFKAFPRLKHFGFSTNITFPDLIIDIVDTVAEYAEKHGKRNFEVEIQLSIDGPEEIHDFNRGKGTLKICLNALRKLAQHHEKCWKDNEYIDLKMHYKPTIGGDNFDWWLKSGNAKRYYEFWEKDVFQMLYDISPDFVRRMSKFVSPTLAVPGFYTTEDGRKYGEITVIQNEFKVPVEWKFVRETVSPYVFAVERALKALPELYNFGKSNSIYTCSAGDSQWGVIPDRILMPCHEYYFHPYVPFILEILEKYDSSAARFPITHQMFTIPNGLADLDDELDVSRVCYTYRGFHDFMRFRCMVAERMLHHLWMCGQVSQIYGDRYMRLLAALMVVIRHGCSLGNAMQTGSIHVYPISLLRIFCNGAFESCYATYMERF